MYTVEKTDTYTSKDGSKSTYLTAGDVIADEDAIELGLMSEKDAEKAAEEEKKAQGAAPENKSR
jgi:hypothetical protein